MASLSNSNCAASPHCHLTYTITQFNTFSVLPSDAYSANHFVDHTVSQRQLEDVHLNNLFDAASCADKTRLLSTSSPHASAWLTVIPSDQIHVV